MEIAEQLLKETAVYLRLIGSIDGKDCAKYIVASNSITYNALEIVQPVVDSVCIKASIIDLKLYNQLELYNRICEAQIVLKQIARLNTVEQNVEQINQMNAKLAIAEKQVDIFSVSAEAPSTPDASHPST